ncbi:MAG TPA: NAD-dependent epimerase/dehydratase family protein [Candidatus Saccharimonadales bacterium]|nr:NAD-dependent epimerase/dehydratase family protein [Candidatus Saccharimonadales bacterium]
MKILWTGAAGFIAGYTIEELLNHGHEVVGIDNFSKYGKVEKSYDNHPNYKFIEGDAKDVELMKKAVEDVDVIVSGAAMIGGISYFHEFAYELLAENERITAAAFDAAIWAFKNKKLKKIVVMSSSMVYESTDQFPSPETAIKTSPPPISTYGFQKLACEYFARGGWEQYQLPYTIIRPFNCVGIGEKRALSDKEIYSGNVKLAMSHVVPDLVQKIVKKQDPLHILGKGNQVRHYTYGGDLARGIRLCIEKKEALNEDFNISTAQSTSVIELAEVIWEKLNGDKPFRFVSDKPFEHDVQKRVPDTTKAKKMLGYETTTSLDKMLDEVIPWIVEQVKHGNI